MRKRKGQRLISRLSPFSLERSLLSSPVTAQAQLEWIELRGVPDYRDPPAEVQRWPDGRTVAGSENSDHVRSPNSGHRPVALLGQKIVGDSSSDDGKENRDAMASRDPVTAARFRTASMPSSPP